MVYFWDQLDFKQGKAYKVTQTNQPSKVLTYGGMSSPDHFLFYDEAGNETEYHRNDITVHELR